MEPVPRHLLARHVAEALLEDVGPGDVTTESIVPEGLRALGEIRFRGGAVVAGVEAAAMVFRALDATCRITRHAPDGTRVTARGLILSVEGPARAILTGERAALNFLGRLSGIATLTAAFVERAAGRAAIADTRKTTPGFRLLEKHAVAAGGGTNHRSGLWDAILIKDNHVDLAAGVAAAIAAARRGTAGARPIEIEVRSLEEVDQALAAGADALLLDNFEAPALEEAVARARGRAFLEVSGGVTLANVAAIAELGVDRISIGALTHSASAADLTMRISRMTT
ncbi:MAG: carboxylating nicotinate-nucleotide diphosphorylase [Acidobacteria bacterium]|nr:carboxylating nicotinate-nucleotide diphosphorylase [Acidobacteriota bacterium]